jgi:putative FmdB family regulatory protein
MIRIQMPTYDYRCEKCGNEFEDFLPMAKRAEPTKEPCNKQLHRAAPVCGGKISQVPGPTPTAFAYDNISSPGHTKKPPNWMTDKLKEIKKQQAGATMSWHH